VAAVLLGISFYVGIRWLQRGQLSDVTVYEGYAGFVRNGDLPYRDFAFEYPPAALPPILLPAYMSWSYATSFAILMGVCGAGCIAAAGSALRAVEAGTARVLTALLAIGAAPFLLRLPFEGHFDLWPALLAVGGLAALLRERAVLSGLLLGLGFAAKLWPVVLLPIALAYLWRRRGRAGTLAHLAAFVAVAVACFLPFAILAPHGVRAMFADQLNRPLQVESLGAAMLMAAEHLGMRPLTTITSHGAQALSGRGAVLAADLSTALEILTVVAVWIAFARRRDPDGEAVLLAAAATIAALVAFDRVLSPQYLVWLVPFVPLVWGARALLASGALFLALGLTQTWLYYTHYWALALNHASPWSWYLLGRDLALAAIAGLLVLGLSRGRDSGGGTTDWPAVRRAGA
jgi:hypothetical protein